MITTITIVDSTILVIMLRKRVIYCAVEIMAIPQNNSIR